jgi:hypothetical protein
MPISAFFYLTDAAAMYLIAQFSARTSISATSVALNETIAANQNHSMSRNCHQTVVSSTGACMSAAKHFNSWTSNK